MPNSISKELTHIKELINEHKIEDALQLIEDIQKRKDLSLEVPLKIQAYRGDIYLVLGQLEMASEIADNLYTNSQELKLPLLTLDSLFIKIWILLRKQRIKEMLKTFEGCEILFKSIPREDTAEFLERESLFLLMKGSMTFFKGKLDLALKYHHRSLKLFKQVDPKSYHIPTLLWAIAYDYQEKGELKPAQEYANRALNLNPKEENHLSISTSSSINRTMGIIHYQKGDLDSALEYHMRCLDDYKKINMYNWFGGAYLNIIIVLLAKRDLDQANNYLERLRQFAEKYESKRGSLTYQLSDALILKVSSRMRDRVEAEHKLQQIVKKNINIFITNIALVNLCDWYFEEFRISNQMEILDDIPPLIDHLQRNAKLQNSYALLANVKLLQAKLALLRISMVEARKFLTEAQNIADEHDLQLLAGEISKEHDRLLEELKLWESIKKTQASIAERLKLASVDGVIEGLKGRREIEPLESSGQHPVSLLILAAGGLLLFSHPFSEEWRQDNDLFGSFLSAFSSFSDEFFSQGLDRAKFGDDTILLQSVGSFSICYLFRGQTYFAKQKLEKFVETIQKDPAIWETLEKFEKSSQVAELKDLPEMENLLSSVFLS